MNNVSVRKAQLAIGRMVEHPIPRTVLAYPKRVSEKQVTQQVDLVKFISVGSK